MWSNIIYSIKPLISNFGDLREKSQDQKIFDYFSLKKVTFPTGGWQSYEYELHEYLTSNGHVKTKGGGIRVKKITIGDNSPTMSRLYKYGKNENGLGEVSFSPDPTHFADELDYHEIKVPTSALGRIRRYSTDIIGDVNMDNHFVLHYPQVTIYDLDENSNKQNGKTEEFYNISQKYDFRIDPPSGYSWIPGGNHVSNRNKGLYIEAYRKGFAPTLSSRKTYKMGNSASVFQPLSEEQFFYKSVNESHFVGLKVIQRALTNYFDADNPTSNTFIDPYSFIVSFFEYFPYQIITGRNDLLEKKIEIQHTSSGSVTTETNYAYNNQQQVISTSRKQSDGSSINELYKYPSDFAGTSIYNEMINRNMLNPIVEKITKKNSTEIKKEKTNYSIISGTNSFILPSNFQTSFQGSSLKTVIVYDLYDSKGNIRQITDKAGIKTVYLWGYKSQYPIAEIKNATFNEVQNAVKTVFSVASVDDLSALPTLPTPNETKLKDGSLQKQLPNSLVTTYTYKPLVGITSQTDPRGVTIYYDYDNFGRLKEIYRMTGSSKQIIESYEYNYRK